MSTPSLIDQACEDTKGCRFAQALFESWDNGLTSAYVKAHMSPETRSVTLPKAVESTPCLHGPWWRDFVFASLYRLTEQSPEMGFNVHGKLVSTETLRHPSKDEAVSPIPSDGTTRSMSSHSGLEGGSAIGAPTPMQEMQSRSTPHFSLPAHCADGRTFRDAMISTTRSLPFGEEFSQKVKEHTDREQTTSRGWIYVMDPQPHGRDVACYLAASGLTEHAEELYGELEVAVPGHIDTADIRACIPLQRGTTHYSGLVKNPFYRRKR